MLTRSFGATDPSFDIAASSSPLLRTMVADRVLPFHPRGRAGGECPTEPGEHKQKTPATLPYPLSFGQFERGSGVQLTKPLERCRLPSSRVRRHLVAAVD